MVFIGKIVNAVKQGSKRGLKRTFIDSLRLHVRGGTGGNGLPKYGGIGGKGGDVFLVAEKDTKLKRVLSKLPTKRIAAGSGGHSENKKLLGEPGNDIVIEVPVGVSVFDEYGRVIGDLNEDQAKILVAKGGPGGSPLTQFTGLRGEAGTIILDLKLIADVGLVGFPNAGKSSLLKAISRARPKVASYPFTTIEPNVGVLEFSDLRQITMADLPGLIEGAHANVGLGHKFLKHAERTKLILMVVDVNGFQLNYRHPKRSALETVVLLNKEMELYQEDLLKKPIMLAVNKMDVPGAEYKWKELEASLKDFDNAVANFPEELRPLQAIKFQDIMSLSVQSCQKSVLNLKEKIRCVLDSEADKATEEEELKFRNRLKLKMVESGPKLS
ncbi:GTP-binding protein 10 [Gryllus bimaculatus]|nr:GTP-binding protein 10 [Gryllus bimaculatus]